MVKSSVKKFLFFNLLLSITLASSFTAIGSYFLDNLDIQRELDLQLQQSAHLVNDLLVKTHRFSRHDVKSIKIAISHDQVFAQDKFQFQILDAKGKPLLRSSEQFNVPISKLQKEFSTQKVSGKTFRIYTQYNKKPETIFSIGESYTFRAELERRVNLDNFLIILWIYPFLALCIWLIVNRGLNTLKKIASLLTNRSITDFEPIDIQNIPIEIRPFTEALNKLLLKLQHEFERSKRFASDAAHELRTPLAALKTQTQVAFLSAHSEKERKIALNKILNSVDRCIHIVQQLLILSRLSQATIREEFSSTNLYKVLSDVLADLAPTAVEKNIDLALLDSDRQAFVYGNEMALSILVRNIVDNAIRYIPNNGTIETQIIRSDNQLILRVADNGPGIPEELRQRVFERFYRILGTKAQGSGLGLAIVKQIADLHHATIRLSTPFEGTGLIVEVIFSAQMP